MNRQSMRTAIVAVSLAVVLVGVLALHPLRGFVFSHRPAVAEAAATGCNFPTRAGNDEQTAWQLFVAANCSAPPGLPYRLVWENWPEQSQVYQALASNKRLAGRHARNFHVSPLAALMHRNKRKPGAVFLPSTGCATMNGANLIPPSVRSEMKAFTICEEVHLNPQATKFILGANYQERSAQAVAAQKNVDIQFPTAAIEVKTDWIPATDFKKPFSCTHSPKGLHVELVDGTCYAMAGMHIESKLLKNWLWATFEPQVATTNSLRCRLYGPCHDAWGATPAVSHGGITVPTPALIALMRSARIAPAFLNYRLDGVQTQFVTAAGTPTYLGNSIIEGENVGLTRNTASCITCHSMSAVNTAGVDGSNIFPTVHPAVGPACNLSPGWIRRDFVWSMLLAVPAPGPTPQPSAPPSCTNY